MACSMRCSTAFVQDLIPMQVQFFSFSTHLFFLLQLLFPSSQLLFSSSFFVLRLILFPALLLCASFASLPPTHFSFSSTPTFVLPHSVQEASSWSCACRNGQRSCTIIRVWKISRSSGKGNCCKHDVIAGSADRERCHRKGNDVGTTECFMGVHWRCA